MTFIRSVALVGALSMTMTTAACAFQLDGVKPKQAFTGLSADLVEAAITGNTSKMERLVKQGADVNAHDSEGNTPLVWALAAHNHAGLKKLLDLGANPNEKLKIGGTVIWVAAGDEDIEALKILLDAGGDPNVVAECSTVLMQSLDHPDIVRIDLLLARGADINKSACNTSAPRNAAALGRFDIVLYLLEKGYRDNLDQLAISTNNRFVKKDSQAYQDKQKVIELLGRLGAKIPPPKQ